MYQAKKLSEPQGAALTVNSPLWDQVPKGPRFVNIENGKPATLSTWAAVLWSDEHLFIKYWAEEPLLAGTLTERDSLLFAENNLELFIDGGDTHYELEVSVNNVVYEVFFVWRDQTKNVVKKFPQLDPMKADALTFGGNNDRTTPTFWDGTHPRGLRWAYLDWDMPGLETEVAVHGTINDHTDVDEGWDLMIKIPWQSLDVLADGRTLPPTDEDVWHFMFARYELIEELGLNVGWGWDPVGDGDNHVPEKFTPVQFVEDPA